MAKTSFLIQPTFLFLAGGTLLAVYLYSKKREEDAGFEEGFVAGWVSPGPVTIAAAVGGLIYFYG